MPDNRPVTVHEFNGEKYTLYSDYLETEQRLQQQHQKQSEVVQELQRVQQENSRLRGVCASIGRLAAEGIQRGTRRKRDSTQREGDEQVEECLSKRTRPGFASTPASADASAPWRRDVWPELFR